MRRLPLAASCLAALAALGGAGDAEEEPPLAVVPDIAARLARYAPVEIAAELSGVPASERPVLAELVRAGRLMDEVFLRQVDAGNGALAERTRVLPEEVQTYFAVNFGPWDRIDQMEPWLGGAPHPPGAGYYPPDMTKEEFAAWVAAHPEDRALFEGLYHVIRRRDGGLVAVPYSSEYGEWLVPAADHLLAAAGATGNASLRRFLELRAAAFASDEYTESDMAWMDLDSPVEVTIGPYEVYEDGLFGYKAAFEAFVTVDVPAESARLTRYKELLPALEANLPIPEEHKNPNRGSESPIRVVDVVFSGGDTKAGIQTIAFNLPNDEAVRAAKGSKKVLLRNVIRAKYDRILLPIAARTLAEDQAGLVSFDAFLAEVLHHELSHGLGPGFITVDGRQTEVRLELKDLYSVLEEAKADVMGIYDLLELMERGEVPGELRAALEPTYVAGLFRSARFGVHEAHGRGVIAQFNYLLAKGALEVDAHGRFRSVSERFPEGIRDLLHDMLMLQATGDYAGTAAFLERWGRPSEALLAAIERLADVPVDIRPVYRQAEELAP
jgi:hypothetical protein